MSLRNFTQSLFHPNDCLLWLIFFADDILLNCAIKSASVESHLTSCYYYLAGSVKISFVIICRTWLLPELRLNKKKNEKKNETENERKKIRSIDILDKQDLHLACLLAK